MSQARIDSLADAFPHSEQHAAVAAWQDEVADPALLVVHRTFKMRHFQATGRAQFAHSFHRNVKALYRCVRA